MKYLLIFVAVIFLLIFTLTVQAAEETEKSFMQKLIQILLDPGAIPDAPVVAPIGPTSPVVPSSFLNPTVHNYPVNDPLPLLNNAGLVYPQNILTAVQRCLENKEVYVQAAAQTGVAWQVLAGIHSKEGSCYASNSLVSGRKIGAAEPDVKICTSLVGGLGKPKVVSGGCGFDNLLDTAIYAGEHLKGKIQKIPQTHQDLAAALSRYNGGGNSNCRSDSPYRVHCPRLFEGEDDTYVFNKNPDGKHETMYLIYCRDRVKCVDDPQANFTSPIYDGIGVITAAGAIDFLDKSL